MAAQEKRYIQDDEKIHATFLNPGMSHFNAREKWTKPLLVFILATSRLRQDIDTFVGKWPYLQNGM